MNSGCDDCRLADVRDDEWRGDGEANVNICVGK